MARERTPDANRRQPPEPAPEDHAESAPYDLIVVGGGIIGCGIARDAAMRGLRVALVEKHDVGWGTTARSTRLVHGGLRYLEYLDIGLVREALKERATLIRMAPHLVRPLPFLFPIFRRRGRGPVALTAGLGLYDLLARRNLGGHERWSRDRVVRAEPVLDRADLKGAFLFHDAQVTFPERVVVENALALQELGGTVRTHTEVLGLHRHGGVVTGVEVRDTQTGAEETLHGRFIVNATGPWVTEVDSRLGAPDPALTRRTKGVHLLVDRISEHGLVLQCGDGKRIIFVVPWNGASLIGTTDTDYTGDNDVVAATEEDVRYLLDEVNTNLGLTLRPEDVHWTWAGIRSLIHELGSKEGAVSRRHKVVDHDKAGSPENVLTVVGGKITSYRAIAEHVVDRFARRLGAPRAGRGRTGTPLPGGGRFDEVAMRRRIGAALPHLTDIDVERILGLYGARAGLLVDAAQAEPAHVGFIHPGSRLTWEEVTFAVRYEFAATLGDVLLRRTMIGLAPDGALSVAKGVAAHMARLLDWDAARKKTELAAYQATIDRDRTALRALAGHYEPHMPDARVADRRWTSSPR